MRLDASLAPAAPAAGGLALVSQSGAIATALIEWAADRGIGFSAVVSLGGMADVDVGDCIDLLAGDPRTRAILLYLESVPAPRKFLSAARAAARVKPVIAIKAGRTPAAAAAAATHTGALAGEDAVVEAALRRAGMLRVQGLSELFAAAETVARFRPMRAGAARDRDEQRRRRGAGRRPAGRGAGATLAALAPRRSAALDAALPGGWSGGNPVDIGSDAAPDAYGAALAALAADPGVDALLAMNAPGGAGGAGRGGAGGGARGRGAGMIGGKPVLACWMGGAAARAGRALLRARGRRGLRHAGGGGGGGRAPHRLGPAAGGAAPGARPRRRATRREATRAGGARAGRRRSSAAVGRRGAAGADRARGGGGARRLRHPVAGAAASRRRRRRCGAEAAAMLAGRRAGGGEAAVARRRRTSRRSAAWCSTCPARRRRRRRRAAIAARVASGAPAARLDGFALQPMVRRPEAQELILGLGRDPVFGPVILFGAGGVAVELARRHRGGAAAARRRARRRAGRRGRGSGGCSPASAGGRRPTPRRCSAALIALSHLVEDFPCLRAIDVNPLLADAAGRARARRADRDRSRPTSGAGRRTRTSRSGPIRPSGGGRHARAGRRLRAPADPAGGRAALSGVPRAGRARGHPHALHGAAPALPDGVRRSG